MKTVEYSALVGEMWAEIKDLTKRRPAPYDAYFDSVIAAPAIAVGDVAGARRARALEPGGLDAAARRRGQGRR
ncbi:MAG: hypothetical protein M3P38_12885 [Chloroflexota bacterium]|nr:hypothetical protein [Chloroflexota bacterium]